jgi:hypothetical protein
MALVILLYRAQDYPPQTRKVVVTYLSQEGFLAKQAKRLPTAVRKGASGVWATAVGKGGKCSERSERNAPPLLTY